MDTKKNVGEDNADEKIKDDNEAFVPEDTEFKDTISTPSSEKGSFPYDEKRLNYNNNRHVVPAGLIIILFTVYLTTAALQKCFVSTTAQISENPIEFQEIRDKENERQQNILGRFLEHPYVCKDLHIFVKEEEEEEEEEWYDDDDDDSEDSIELTEVTETDAQMTDDNGGESSGNILNEKLSEENVNKITEKSKKQQQQLKKRSNKKNGKHINGHKNRNKSFKNKTNNHNKNATIKKDQQQNKKSSTAEPIIYLFALVFIYLLLKAASDINQHYKSQTKGDKRLRRCSLQSYAQIHKQERRASKDSPIRIRHKQRLMDEYRSKSFDRYTNPTNYSAKKTEILANLRKYTSVDAQHIINNTSKWNNSGSRIDLTNQCEDQFQSVLKRTELLNSSTSVLSTTPPRRCSVPASINCQRQKLTTMPLVSISSSTRRSSLANESFGLNTLTNASTEPETKRRVRMINRH